MKEMMNKIQALIESEENELKEIENVRRKVKARLDSDESLSLPTYRTLIRMLAESNLKTSLHTTFIQELQVLLNETLDEDCDNDYFNNMDNALPGDFDKTNEEEV